MPIQLTTCMAMIMIPRMAAKSNRARKRHVQQQLFRRGGKRRGAGRKPKGARAGERHQAPPAFKPHHALHVLVRIVAEAGHLRVRATYQTRRGAAGTPPPAERS